MEANDAKTINAPATSEIDKRSDDEVVIVDGVARKEVVRGSNGSNADSHNSQVEIPINKNSILAQKIVADKRTAELEPEEAGYFINDDDGFPVDGDCSTLDYDDQDDDIDEGVGGDDEEADEAEKQPKSIIVAGVHADVFTKPELKSALEEIFRQFGEPTNFLWLRSFQRLRVTYATHEAAAEARKTMHEFEMAGGWTTKCYFAQTAVPSTERNLRPPAPYKQFLISPPASPPAGWEPRAEGEPLVNHDLLAALANLMPGASHQLHAPAVDGQPAIVVHTAGLLSDKENALNDKQPASIQQTRCPERV